MFKSWRSDKKKIKVVFQLQFQATQVPKLKKSGVTIALVPEDVGKPTLRSEKVAVQDGSCLWENPVYETVKMIREMKTGKLSEKIYHFVVSNGSSKAGFLGEASIYFADFAAETEPVTVSLPLKFANSGAILHVTIHKIEGAEDLTISREGSLHSQGMNYSDNLQNLTEDWDLETAELFSPLQKNSMPQRAADTGKKKKYMHRRTNTDWSGGSTSDGSLAELANSPEDIPREWHKGSKDPVEKLRSENAMLSRQVEVLELELQSLRKQISKENKWTQDLSRQISSLKEERDAVKMEFEQLKSKKNMDEEESDSGSEDENEGSRVLLKEIRQELEHEKELNANLRLQLQKTEDSNSNLILAVRNLNEMLQKKNREIARLSNEIEASTSVEEARSNEQHDADEMHMLKQTITDMNAELEFYKKHKEELEMHIEELSQENDNMLSQLKQNQQQESMKTENENSEYLVTINELESQVQRLEDKIKQQSEDYSESLISINELESQVRIRQRTGESDTTVRKRT
ncbi:myosin-3-like isoform X2 [Hibiscus syriacus]|uniref:myosin-3-like isoform X2 n=1 Tax=Hibiscus syriacus TaxID=106335 RepID=UPI0019223698|nr:myosin-3-like isoform X2 [Hibiscus syriacus]